MYFLTNIYLRNFLSPEHGPVSVVVPVDDTSKLVAGSGNDLIYVDWDGAKNLAKAKLEVLTTVDLTHTNTRTNDGKVDSSGRLWIGKSKMINGNAVCVFIYLRWLQSCIYKCMFLTGTMGDEINGQPSPPNLGSLYRIDEQLKPLVEISPVSISNGLAWNREDDTFYYIDSPTREIAAYDYDPINGTISKKLCLRSLSKT